MLDLVTNCVPLYCISARSVCKILLYTVPILKLVNYFYYHPSYFFYIKYSYNCYIPYCAWYDRRYIVQTMRYGFHCSLKLHPEIRVNIKCANFVSFREFVSLHRKFCFGKPIFLFLSRNEHFNVYFYKVLDICRIDWWIWIPIILQCKNWEIFVNLDIVFREDDNW